MTGMIAEPIAREEPPAAQAADQSVLMALTEAVQRYCDLMYDCDVSRFDTVFRSTVHLHGFRDGKMVSWSAETYKDILAKRTSPKSMGARGSIASICTHQCSFFDACGIHSS